MTNEAELPQEPTQTEKAMQVLVVEPKLAGELLEFYGPDRIVQAFDPNLHASLIDGASQETDELPELPA